MWARFLSQEDSLEEGVATHSSILAWRIPRTEKPDGLQPTGLRRVRHEYGDLARTHHLLFLMFHSSLNKDELWTYLSNTYIDNSKH